MMVVMEQESATMARLLPVHRPANVRIVWRSLLVVGAAAMHDRVLRRRLVVRNCYK